MRIDKRLKNHVVHLEFLWRITTYFLSFIFQTKITSYFIIGEVPVESPQKFRVFRSQLRFTRVDRIQASLKLFNRNQRQKKERISYRWAREFVSALFYEWSPPFSISLRSSQIFLHLLEVAYLSSEKILSSARCSRS